MRVCILLLLAACTPATDPDYDAAWEIACSVQDEYSCEGLSPPAVTEIYSDAWRGGYNGADDIAFNPTLPKDRIEKLSTLIHEDLHYLEYQQSDISYRSQKDICDTENFSYTTVNDWLETVGRTDLQIHRWWETQEGHRGYWKCIPWYAGFPDFVVSEPSFGPGETS